MPERTIDVETTSYTRISGRGIAAGVRYLVGGLVEVTDPSPGATRLGLPAAPCQAPAMGTPAKTIRFFGALALTAAIGCSACGADSDSFQAGPSTTATTEALAESEAESDASGTATGDESTSSDTARPNLTNDPCGEGDASAPASDAGSSDGSANPAELKAAVDALPRIAPGTIEMIDAGSEPRVALRYELTEGDCTPFRATVRGQTADLRVTVLEVADDGYSIETEVVSTPSRSGTFGTIVGVAGRTDHSISGQILEAGPVTDLLAQNFDVEPIGGFPSEPVGLGATWSVTRDIDPNPGEQLVQVITYTIKEIDNSIISLDIALTEDLVGAEPGRGPIAGLGSAVVDLTSPIQVETQLSITLNGAVVADLAVEAF